MSYRRQVSIRLPEEIEEAAKKAAATDRRSMANWIERTLVAALIKQGELPTYREPEGEAA